MAKVADLLISIGADIDDFKKSMKQMQNQMKETGKQLQSIGKDMSMGLTAPLVGVGTAMVMTASNFESSMNKVKAISGATGDDFDKLRDQAQELGSTTKFSASEAAEGMSFLAMAGFETNEVLGAMPGLLDMAAASGMDLASAADIASNIMSGFSLNAEDAGHVADVLAKASSSSNTNVHQLGEAMKYAAPMAQSLGLSMEETAAAIGIMSDAGIQGSMAGTALRGGLTRLSNPSKEAAKTMQELGFSAFDAEGNMKDMNQIIYELNDATADLTKEQKAQALSTVFGQEAMSGWMSLLARGGDELLEFDNQLVNSEGSAKDMADTMNGGLSGAIKTLKSSLEGLAIEFGDILLPVITAITDKLTKVVRWFSNLSDSTKAAILIVSGLVASIGPLLFMLGMIMTVMGSLTAPIVAVVVVVASLIATFGILMAKSQTFRELMSTVWSSVKDITMTVINVIKEFLLSAWTTIQELWTTHGNTIIRATLTAFETVKQVIKNVLDVVMTVITTVWTTLKTFWQENGQSILDNTLSIFNSIKEFIMTTLNIIWTLWQTHGQTIIEFIITVFQSIWTTISTVLVFVQDLIASVLEVIMNFWNNHGQWLMTFIVNTFMAIFNTVSSVLTSVWSFINTILTTLKEFWQEHGDAIVKIIQVALDIIMGIVKFAMPFIQALFTTVFGVIKTVVSTAWNFISTIFETSVDVVLGIVGIFADLLTGDFEGAFNGLLDIVTDIWDGIKSVFKAGVNAVISLVNSMIGGLNKLSFDVPDWVPGMGGKSFGLNIPKIPMLAEGGITTGPTLAMIGEGAEQEAVLPLSKLDKLMNSSRSSQTVIVELDGRQIAKGTLPHMEQEIRLRTGLRM